MGNKKIQLICQNPLLIHYRIIEKLGQNTYSVLHSQTQCKKILKLIPINQKYRLIVENQINLMMILEHNNAIRIQSAFFHKYTSQLFSKENSGTIIHLHIIMQYVKLDCKNFTDLVGKISNQNILQLYAQFDSLLKYVHKKGIVLNNLRFDKILWSNRKTFKYFCCIISEQTIFRNSQQQNFEMFSSKYYKSKVIMNNHMMQKSVDYWALGIILLELILGLRIYQYSLKIPSLDELFLKNITKLNINNLIKNLIFQCLLYTNNQNIEISKPIQSVQQQNSVLIIPYCDLSDTDLKSIINKQNLSTHVIEINCSNCNLTNSCGYIFLNQTPKLKKLNISSNQINDEFIKIIKVILKRFTVLKIAFTQITDHSMEDITNQMIHCEIIDISYTRITENSIKLLVKLNNLKELYVFKGNQQIPIQYYQQLIYNWSRNFNKTLENKIYFNKQSLNTIMKLQLQALSINLGDSDGSDIVLSMSPQMNNIEMIGRLNQQALNVISTNKNMKKIFVYQTGQNILALKNENLQSFCLIKCKANIRYLNQNISKFKKLEVLNLKSNYIGLNGIKIITKYFSNLIILDLSNNYLTSQGLYQLLYANPNIKYLNLNNNQIEDQGAQIITNAQVKLQYLLLYKCSIGDIGFVNILIKLKSLFVLNLNKNNLSEKCILDNLNKTTSLKTLFLGENSISLNTKQIIRKRHQNIYI